jgi:hypothetical protein
VLCLNPNHITFNYSNFKRNWKLLSPLLISPLVNNLPSLLAINSVMNLVFGFKMIFSKSILDYNE